MPVDNPEVIARYLALSRENSIPIDGTCVDRLHDNGLKSDKLAQKWVMDSIRLTNQLGVQVLLIPFFGKWALGTPGRQGLHGRRTEVIWRQPRKARVILGVGEYYLRSRKRTHSGSGVAQKTCWFITTSVIPPMPALIR